MNLTRTVYRPKSPSPSRSSHGPDLVEYDYPHWVVAIMLVGVALAFLAGYKLIDFWSQWR